MTIKRRAVGETVTLALSGRLDTITAPLLEEHIRAIEHDIHTLTFDFSELIYVSSAGLRVLLIAQKQMSGQGKMLVCNVSQAVQEVLDITGFSDILSIV